MKLLRILSRVVLLSLAAAAFVVLTGSFGRSARLSLPSARWQAERRDRQSGPQVSDFGEFLAAGGLVVFWALAGRIALRLRLSPKPRSEGQPVLLGLHRLHHEQHDARTTGVPDTGTLNSAKFN